MLKRTFADPVLVALVLLSAALAVWGVWREAMHPGGDLLTVVLIWGSAALPTAWSVLSVIWSEQADGAVIVAFQRTLLVPAVVCWVPAVAMAIAAHTPEIRAHIEAENLVNYSNYFLASDGDSLLFQTLVLCGVGAMVFAMLLGLLLTVLVVLPVLAWLKPIATARSNMLLTDTAEDRVAAKRAIRMVAGIFVLIFVVTSLIFFGSRAAHSASVIDAFANIPKYLLDPLGYLGDIAWVLGVLAIPFGVWLVISTLRVQRPDLELRAERGVNSLADQRKAERGRGGRSRKKR